MDKPINRYDPARNGLKVCWFCGHPVEQGRNSITIGMCADHARMRHEDITIGLHKQDRLREMILAAGPESH